MHRVQLIHWNAAEARDRAARLGDFGYDVDYEPLEDFTGLRALRQSPPKAVVIDLGRLPSQGRDLALALWASKSTRHVPVVFVGGDPKKVERIRGLLPDAVYTGWDRIGADLKRAISHPPAEPYVPKSAFEGYASTPLPKKLGIKADSVVALVGAPEGFEETLGELPEGVIVKRHSCSPSGVTLWFVTSREAMQGSIDQMANLAAKGGLWIVWAKKSSRTATDLSQAAVREVGLSAGLVDYKVCAIDATWSGLRFTKRRAR